MAKIPTCFSRTAVLPIFLVWSLSLSLVPPHPLSAQTQEQLRQRQLQQRRVGQRQTIQRAQVETRAIPGQDYLLSLSLYREGELDSALRGFRSALRGGMQSIHGRWIDSICYYAMLGECLYDMGQTEEALRHYNSAVKIYLANPNWLLRMQFVETVPPLSRRINPPINWGASKRRSVPGNFPKKMTYLRGNLQIERTIQQGGGVIVQPEFFPLYAVEIVRCTALAIRRRAEIMGPTCQHSNLTEQLVDALERRPGIPNHWSQSWISSMLGMAYSSDGQDAEAIAELQKSLRAGGQYDHPMTAASLIELGKIVFRQGKLKTAATFFLEATFSAAAYEQYEVLEEAFRWGVITHLTAGNQELYLPLVNASKWARRKSKRLQGSLLVSGAENFAHNGDIQRAPATLKEARSVLARKDLLDGRLGAKLLYQTALVYFQKGDLKRGMKAFSDVMQFQQKASRRLLQINLVDEIFQSGNVSERVADDLFAVALREPDAADWRAAPIETMSVLVTPHVQPLEHWFELCLERRQHEKALEIADQIRRHRFYCTLPMGGRLLALRWVLAAPLSTLSPKAQLQRQNLLVDFPRFADLSEKIATIRKDLNAMPLVPEANEDKRSQTQKLAELLTFAAEQELILRQIALRRKPSEFAFPPTLDVKAFREKMNDGTAVLAFIETKRALFGFFMGREKYGQWRIDNPKRVRAMVSKLLRAMGHFEKNTALGEKELANQEWQPLANELMAELTNGFDRTTLTDFEELVIVPDGLLWYVPFEMLPTSWGTSTTYTPLIQEIRVRYLPTVALAQRKTAGFEANLKTMVDVGKIFPRDDESIGETAFAQLQDTLPEINRFPDKLPAPSGLYSKLLDRAIVLSDIQDSDRLPLQWSPITVDRGKPGSTVSNWSALPWGTPQQLLLPGFHTMAENSLKNGGTGYEIFLTSCALMATGSQTILLSRWRTGGQSCYHLIQEFAQELPHTAAADAWQRSVQLTMMQDLEPTDEPRVQDSLGGHDYKLDHPFFWSGYMLMDTGNAPPDG